MHYPVSYGLHMDLCPAWGIAPIALPSGILSARSGRGDQNRGEYYSLRTKMMCGLTVRSLFTCASRPQGVARMYSNFPPPRHTACCGSRVAQSDVASRVRRAAWVHGTPNPNSCALRRAAENFAVPGFSERIAADLTSGRRWTILSVHLNVKLALVPQIEHSFPQLQGAPRTEYMDECK